MYRTGTTERLVVNGREVVRAEKELSCGKLQVRTVTILVVCIPIREGARYPLFQYFSTVFK